MCVCVSLSLALSVSLSLSLGIDLCTVGGPGFDPYSYVSMTPETLASFPVVKFQLGPNPGSKGSYALEVPPENYFQVPCPWGCECVCS